MPTLPDQSSVLGTHWQWVGVAQRTIQTLDGKPAHCSHSQGISMIVYECGRYTFAVYFTKYIHKYKNY